MKKLLSLLLCVFPALLHAATFGTVVQITGGCTDLVIDEQRNRVYIVNSTQNRIEVYNTQSRQLTTTIPVDQQPMSIAISRDAQQLYVTSYGSSLLDVIDLNTNTVVRRVGLPNGTEGVATGNDGRVLITTTGGIFLFDPSAVETSSLRNITSTLPTPVAPTTPTSGQVYNSTRSQLMSSQDGNYIVGLVIATTTTRTLFVYEVASGTILRSRTVSNISNVLSVAPDGSKFMSGLTLFDTGTLAVLAQQNAANSSYPFAANVNFNLQQNQGGSVFAPDGQQMYSAFNIAPVGATKANISQLMISDPDNLLIRLGLQLPENLTGKIVITSNGQNAYALSQSGMLVLPLSTIYNNPIAVPETTAVLLTNDQCGATASTRTGQVNIANAGTGRLTATLQIVDTAGVTATQPLGGNTPANGNNPAFPGPGGGGPGQQIPIVLPGNGGTITIPITTTPTTTQQTAATQNAPTVQTQSNGNGVRATFTYNSRNATSLGTPAPADFLVSSPEAINIPARVRVYQNNRNTETTGTILPAATSISTAEGLVDIVADPIRPRLYIANSGLNRVEVFDTGSNTFLAPIKVGQLPRSIALAPDNNTLYVANTGGESISIVDLNQGKLTGSVRFPPVAYNATYAIVTPSVIAATLSGLQVVMSSGALWKVVNNEALPRPTSQVIGTATLQTPRSLVSSPGGEYALLLAGSGVAYLYDAMSDDFVLSQTVVSTPIQGYFGAMSAGPRGQYFVVNGQILNRSLTPVVSTSTTRPIAAVTAVSTNMIARLTQPARSSATAAVTDTPTLELLDATTGQSRGTAVVLEGPLSTQTGTTRVNVSARTMAVDAQGTTAYVLTSSGLSVVALNTPPAQTRMSINTNGIVNTGSYTTSMAAGSVVSIFGQNLASSATATQYPLPSLLGGSCVTIDNTPVPLMMTSPSQINLQLPVNLTAARHTVIVRSGERAQATSSASITVSKSAPAVYVNADTGMASVYRRDGSPVSAAKPAKRDESLLLFATGLGATTGAAVATGSPAPSEPLAEISDVQVFFGNPSIAESEMIVDWTGLIPGMVGVYQVNLRVPGSRVKGDKLPVSLRVGSVSSPTTGTNVPVIAVE